MKIGIIGVGAIGGTIAKKLVKQVIKSVLQIQKEKKVYQNSQMKLAPNLETFKKYLKI